mgnify:CR=1 FL=1
MGHLSDDAEEEQFDEPAVVSNQSPTTTASKRQAAAAPAAAESIPEHPWLPNEYSQIHTIQTFSPEDTKTSEIRSLINPAYTGVFFDKPNNISKFKYIPTPFYDTRGDNNENNS